MSNFFNLLNLDLGLNLNKIPMCSQIKFFKLSYIFYLLFVFGVILVFYFSWINSPRLALSGVLPKWISNWADSYENWTRRTAVPFVFLSILIGIRLIITKAPLKRWLLNYILLIFLVILAEFVQIFLPHRIFDWRDIAWGVIGSTFGLVIFYILNSLFFNQ